MGSFKLRSHTLAALTALLSVASTSTLAADNTDKLAKELIELRATVETLSSELDSKKDEHKNKMSALAIQKADLEAELQRGELRIKQQEQSLEKSRELAIKNNASADVLKPVLFDTIKILKERISSALPFKVEERLAALGEIEQQLNSGILPPQKAANRLWAFYEDEIRLTKENGVYRQTIVVDGEETLAEVARIGMVMMFFQTTDQRMGVARKTDAGWKYETLASGSDNDQVATLFDALKKQIRTGYFEIPNALAN